MARSSALQLGCATYAPLHPVPGHCPLRQGSQVVRRVHRRPLAQPARATTDTEVNTELLQLQAALRQRREEMAACVEREDFSGAAAARDTARLLELHLRDLQLKQEESDRKTVKHRLGHVIKHRRFGYRGVIAGFSYECEASETWCKIMHVDALPLGRRQPFYHVLVDKRDKPNGSLTYVAQENIIPARKPTEIQHPLVETYFTRFDESTGYEPTYTLRSQYPQQPF